MDTVTAAGKQICALAHAAKRWLAPPVDATDGKGDKSDDESPQCVAAVGQAAHA
jgi:hypothetical protein